MSVESQRLRQDPTLQSIGRKLGQHKKPRLRVRLLRAAWKAAEWAFIAFCYGSPFALIYVNAPHISWLTYCWAGASLVGLMQQMERERLAHVNAWRHHHD